MKASQALNVYLRHVYFIQCGMYGCLGNSLDRNQGFLVNGVRRPHFGSECIIHGENSGIENFTFANVLLQ